VGFGAATRGLICAKHDGRVNTCGAEYGRKCGQSTGRRSIHRKIVLRYSHSVIPTPAEIINSQILAMKKLVDAGWTLRGACKARCPLASFTQAGLSGEFTEIPFHGNSASAASPGQTVLALVPLLHAL
jgi:hypothetical protein